MAADVMGKGDESEEVGVQGEASEGDGVFGLSHAPGKAGVLGINDDATPNAGPGVVGKSAATGVIGESTTWHGVFGKSVAGGHGVAGEGPVGVSGVGHSWIGVYGETQATDGGPSGVLGEGKEHGVGVKGHASGQGVAAVAGYHLTRNGPGIYGEGAPAGLFNGDVVVTGDIQLPGADLAEQFDLDGEAPADPGCVLVIAGPGRVKVGDREYDPGVVGVVSGAGSYRPALILDHQAGPSRPPLALTGKVWCKADAELGPIQAGDLLTTSSTPGHAMKASDPSRSFGAVLGKALDALPRGRGLIPMLVALH